MTSVFKRGDGKYCAKWKDSSGKWRYVYRSSEDAVREALQQAIRDAAVATPAPTPTDKRYVGALLDEWLDELHGTVSRRTYLNRESLVRIHLRPTLGTVRIDRVSSTDVRRLLRGKLDAGLSPGTVKRLHMILKAVLPSEVMAGIKPPRAQQEEMHVLSKYQVLHLLDTVRGDRLEAVYVLGALCGLRIGEALALRWEDVNLDKGTVQVRRTVWRGKIFQPKTASSRRTLTLPERALDALVRLRNKSDGSGYIFATSGGNPVDPANFHRWSWRPMIRKAGMPSTLTYHKLRHGAASLLLNEGVPVPVVSRYLGHSNPGTTMRVYAHALDGTSHVAAAAMDGLLR